METKSYSYFSIKSYLQSIKRLVNIYFSVKCDKTPADENGPKTFLLKRPKRQIDPKNDPKDHLDAQISFILTVLPFFIDWAEETIEKNVKFLVANKLTWGWAVVVGGLLDFYSDFVLKGRESGNFGDIATWWGYGTTGFYAIGFGFPYLIGLEEDNLPCHSTDFSETLDQYQLTNGLDQLFGSSLTLSTIRAIVSEFDMWVRIKIACITDFEGSYLEAAQVIFLLDELNTAMNLRIDIEQARRDQSDSVFTEKTIEDYFNDGLDHGGLNQVPDVDRVGLKHVCP